MDIIEINEKEWTEQEGLSSTGKRVKAWYARNSDGKIFLYKIPKRYKETGFLTFEMWTEIIAYYVGKELGLDLPAISPAQDNDSYGVLIENFLGGKEVLHEAKDYLKSFGKEHSHNIMIIKEYILDKDYLMGTLTAFLLISGSFITEKILKDNFKYSDSFFWNEYKKMLIFDCLIGNNDRHDENWGLCYDSNKANTGKLGIKLAPIYDNASCLAKELTEEGIEQLLKDEKKFNIPPPN